MKVRQLIKQLQKMPQNLEVYYAHHDNREYETAGSTFGVRHHVKADYQDIPKTQEDEMCFAEQPREWITIHG